VRLDNITIAEIETAALIAFEQFRAAHPMCPLPENASAVFKLGFSAGTTYGAKLAAELVRADVDVPDSLGG
jgi:hypothetical protein